MIANDGFSEVGEEKRASATCFCGNIQLSFVGTTARRLSLDAKLTV
jgi:hypothetical protein